MFPSFFIFLIFLTIFAIEWDFVCSDANVGVSNEMDVENGAIKGNVPGKEELNVRNVLDKLNSSMNDFENQPEIGPKSIQKENDEQYSRKAFTLVLLFQHKMAREKCKEIVNKVGEFYPKAVNAHNVGVDFWDFDYFAKDKSADEELESCALSNIYLNEAAKSGEYTELVKLAQARVKKDSENFRVTLNEFMKKVE